MNKHVIIFTDLDGTLLDRHYSFKEALPALHVVKKRNIPLVLCSSKTRVEIERTREKLDNDDPFISENGGGIFVPRGYFKFRIPESQFQIDEDEKYLVIKLGASYDLLRNALEELRSEKFDVKGFGDMTVKEVSELTGLKLSDARLARERDFDEPFVFVGKESFVNKLKRRIRAKGFNYTQGEFLHIMGDSDKGRAVETVKGLYSKIRKRIMTVALGDSPNDIEMLRCVDYPVVVQKADGSYHPQVVKEVKGIVKADGIGPEGWNRAVMTVLSKL
jgi:mannosyl-3-phosphoglycerate phosphatase